MPPRMLPRKNSVSGAILLTAATAVRCGTILCQISIQGPKVLSMQNGTLELDLVAAVAHSPTMTKVTVRGATAVAPPTKVQEQRGNFVPLLHQGYCCKGHFGQR